MAEKETNSDSQKQDSVKRKKFVRNRSGHKVELVIEGKVFAFLPGKVVEVPLDFAIPNGLGIYTLIR